MNFLSFTASAEQHFLANKYLYQSLKEMRRDTQRSFRAKIHYFCLNLVKIEMSPQILIELSNIQYLANQSTGSCVFTLKRE